jgi:hypothetical protein
MSAFPARSIRPNACARIRDAKITPCSQGVLPEDKFRLVKPSACQACRWGCGGMVPAPTQCQTHIAVPVTTAAAATWLLCRLQSLIPQERASCLRHAGTPVTSLSAQQWSFDLGQSGCVLPNP